MDGNGHWAHPARAEPHRGAQDGRGGLIDITCGAIELGIKHLERVPFSTENWRRSADEVRFLMGFNREVVRRRRRTSTSWA